MSTDAEAATPDESRTEAAERIAALETRIEELEDAVANATAAERDDEKSMVIIATQGTLDMAYPPLILASTAAAFDWDVTVFHTFWGLDILHEERAADLKLSAVGNPNMPVPNAIAALPGMDRLATTMMERRIADNDVATIGELLETSLEMGVDLQACQMTMDLMDYDDDAFYDGVTVGVGAATALSQMADADLQLLV
ncbi:DsrE/DsrF/DrsH-like family protein [Haloarcula sp. GH36]|uniref:DsrE/DsrF/DrsH-like family protein n=1 Tax=Haloarcula montana TaxID=3111776 RepID=UPI002D76FEFB|nr:DsrE/DsrF/DrsH-like family protein [Haloarcula sp. GH36]